MSTLTTPQPELKQKPTQKPALILSAKSLKRQKLFYNIFIYTLLIGGATLLMLPFLWLVSNSLKTDQEISIINQFFPKVIQWENYPKALAKMGMVVENGIPRFPALANTTVITVLCVIGQVLSSSLVGYGFARYNFRGRNILFMIMLSTMMLPAQVTMIPVFLLFRSVGWIDSLLPLIIPAWFGTPFFIFMFRQFFSQIPESLLEAARIDGASNLRIYFTIMLPLSAPVIAIVAIYTFMFAWNDFMSPLIYLNSPEMRTLALELNTFNGQYGVQNRELLMAASFLTMLPCIVLFFAAQRYFMDNAASSGMKG
ncbi:L-arabinose transport system permease protein AraQ [Poriferisphaera corsica]|uniref:sn-glycerol-3-phosphate transport system permease protein UgpE n=1 Tax=Poriferisphaera corsica TaxID=2528020 RepID=A0A517YXF5_9BACT|nr:carbohydrate ABC transporter permease [Poriferisphaera corsica]QDU34908.1 L-arabinose transport system permease protein AraQ [Poriferisphaera corsica]